MRSADSQVIEPGDLWQQRLPSKTPDRAPRLVNSIDSLRDHAKGEWLVCEGISPQREAGSAAADVEDPRERAAADGRGSGAIRSRGWDPAQRLRDQEVDGVGFEVLYPSIPLQIFAIPDFVLRAAVATAETDIEAAHACRPNAARFSGWPPPPANAPTPCLPIPAGSGVRPRARQDP